MLGFIKQIKNLFPITVTDAVLRNGTNKKLTDELDELQLKKQDKLDYIKTEVKRIDGGKEIDIISPDEEGLNEYTLWELLSQDGPTGKARENTLTMDAHDPNSGSICFMDQSIMYYGDPSLTINFLHRPKTAEDTTKAYIGFSINEDTGLLTGGRSDSIMKWVIRHNGLAIKNENETITIGLNARSSAILPDDPYDKAVFTAAEIKELAELLESGLKDRIEALENAVNV